MQTFHAHSSRTLFLKAAILFENSVRNILCVKSHVVVGMCGGTIVNLFFNALKRRDIPWEKIHLFLTDERIVAEQSTERNDYLFTKNLAGLPLHYHPFTKHHTLSTYTAELHKMGGFDLLILSAGEDGHIASLFPGHNTLKSPGQKYLSVHNAPKPPPSRITISLQMILSAPHCFLFFAGQSKQHAYELFSRRGLVTTLPARIVKRVKNVFIFTTG